MLVRELQGIAPDTFKVNDKGHFEIGGCDLVELADEFGTPLFIYDQNTINNKIDAYKKAFSATDIDAKIIYASKAFNSLALCRLVDSRGLYIDVSSAGEIYSALSAGVSGSKLYFHGNNKEEDELALAIENNIGRVVVDSIQELDRIEKLAGKKGVKVKALIRVTPGVKAYTHKYLETGVNDCKFGFGIRHDVAKKAILRALSCKNLELVGIHVHIGSQIFSIESYEKAIALVIKFLARIKKETEWQPAELNLGGGIGVKYTNDDNPFEIDEFAKKITDRLKTECREHKMSIPELALEPGRSLVANSGVTIYRIGTIKEIPETKTYVSVDGGMSDNMRPSLYDAKYEAAIANKGRQARDHTVSIAGKHCESGDILIKETKIQKPEVGDILATFVTGAYGYSMSNNYNKQTRPAVVMVDNGKARVIIRRETLKDLMRLDVGQVTDIGDVFQVSRTHKAVPSR